MNDTERDSILLELREEQKKANDTLIKITTVLQGYNGVPGLCKMVDDNHKAINRLWIVVTVLGASIGGSAYGIVKALLG